MQSARLGRSAYRTGRGLYKKKCNCTKVLLYFLFWIEVRFEGLEPLSGIYYCPCPCFPSLSIRKLLQACRYDISLLSHQAYNIAYCWTCSQIDADVRCFWHVSNVCHRRKRMCSLYKNIHVTCKENKNKQHFFLCMIVWWNRQCFTLFTKLWDKFPRKSQLPLQRVQSICL